MAPRPRAPFAPGLLRKLVPAAIAAALLLGTVAIVIARGLISSPPPADPPAREPAADEFVRFTDAAGGISISHPAGWRRTASPDPEVRLLAEGEGSSMLVRISDFGAGAGPKDLDAAKALTDKLVRDAGRVKMVRPAKRVTLGGLPGYLYLYTFADAASGQRAAHAHYFLFRGRNLITIVFQAVPAQRLPLLAPLYDRIGDTLRSTSGGA